MAIKLAWGSANITADSVVIYRSLAKIDLAALPDPLVTLEGTATDYTDTTAARNTVYNYVIAINKGSDTVLTQNKVYGHFPDTGPGPATLLRGSWNDGYFGSMPQTDFYSNSDLGTALGMTASAINTTQNTQIWHKFILDGKILFIPQSSLSSNYAFRDVYNLGCVYGTNDFGDHLWPDKGINGGTGVNQYKTVTKYGYTFLVRLPKGSTLPTSAVVPTTWDDNNGNSEWYQTMGRIFLNQATNAIRTRYDDYLYVANASYNGHMQTMTQHWTAATNVLFLGTSTGFDTIMPSSWGGVGYWWRPVLELVL